MNETKNNSSNYIASHSFQIKQQLSLIMVEIFSSLDMHESTLDLWCLPDVLLEVIGSSIGLGAEGAAIAAVTTVATYMLIKLGLADKATGTQLTLEGSLTLVHTKKQ